MKRYEIGKTSGTRFRGTVAKGFATESPDVSLEGGNFAAGIVRDFAVITRGEALGHGLWIDKDFVASVDEALPGKGTGAKSRYTHPDLSGSGLAKGLGRVTNSGGSSEDVVRGDLHFWKSSRKSPDGDLALHVVTRAEEDPDSFGASISFYRDFEAEVEFLEANGATRQSDDWGDYLDLSTFVSPDPENVHNLPHARLGELLAVDIVDDPAANPGGLFVKGRDNVFDEAEALLEYALGLEDQVPALSAFDMDPERVSSFVSKFLDTRGLQIMRINSKQPEGLTADAVIDDPIPAEPVDESPDMGPEDPVDEAPTDSVPEDVPSTDETPGIGELSRFVDAFGAENGSKWILEGIDFSEAQTRHSALQAKRIEQLEKQLAQARVSESEPVSDGTASTGKSGFAGMIRFRGAPASNN
jgi:hypothetical protein